jgi:hypothetical protein
MNQNEQELLEGLRALAADGPQEAPAHLEDRLLAELRRRSGAGCRNVRRNVWLAAGTGAIAAGLAVLLWVHPAPRKSPPSVAFTAVPAPPTAWVQAAAPTPPKPRRLRRASAASGQELAAFYPLPDTEELPPVENATVVRVQLPMSSLRLIGFPVNEERAGERIEADVLMGQDGLARGVRFVQ